MILEMYVKDFVLIDEIRISFDETISALSPIGILKG